jgi:hypothetical protein
MKSAVVPPFLPGRGRFSSSLGAWQGAALSLPVFDLGQSGAVAKS